MDLPVNEKELRIQAVKVVKRFLEEAGVDQTLPSTIPIFTITDLKGMAVWVARESIRQYCSALEGLGDLDMAGQFTDDEDEELNKL